MYMYTLGTASHSWTTRADKILAEDSEVLSAGTLVQAP